MFSGNTTCILLNKHKCEKLHNEELHSLYSSLDITRIIKSRRIRTVHVVCMGEVRNVYKILAAEHKGKRPLRRLRHAWEDNIKISVRDIGYQGVDMINLAWNSCWWKAPVNTEMNL
jgi:hypothetical protein